MENESCDRDIRQRTHIYSPDINKRLYHRDRRKGFILISAVCIFDTVAIAWIVYRLWSV